MTVAVVAVASVAAAVAAIRWLRVAQREHYLPGTVSRFGLRWWSTRTANLVLLSVAVLSIAVVPFVPDLAAGALVVVAAVSAVAPLGLSLRGVSSPLAWTSRLRRLAAGLAVLWSVLVASSLLAGAVAASAVTLALALLALPAVTDLALLVLSPLERRFGSRWVEQASRTLAQVSPTVVAITGSYGKTTTKEYARRILSDIRPTVASPASFNNRMGLARTINERLVPGVEVFIAEMGAYGPGEIADLCAWVQPTVGVITAIGPVHLERFGTLDRTLAAKAEILERADVAVLNVDDPRLAALADDLTGLRVVRCSVAGAPADVSLGPIDDGYEVIVGGKVVGAVGEVALPSNLACAIGIAVALEVPLGAVPRAVAGAATPQHRQTVYRSDLGFDIVDDTYNSNPAGALAAIERLTELGGGRRVVVTPGMVELGRRQHAENVALGRLAAASVDVVIVVGRTNRAALLEGTKAGPASVIVMRSRQDAVDWVRANLGPGDAVLYENDLPDHYP